MENKDGELGAKIEIIYINKVNQRDKILEHILYHMKNYTDVDDYFKKENIREKYKKLFSLNSDIYLLEELIK